MKPIEHSTVALLLVGAVAASLTFGLRARASAGAPWPSGPSRSATACPGKTLQRTAGGVLNREVRYHGEGPETEEAFLCGFAGGRPFRIEGPEGSGDSFSFSGLTFAGEWAAVAFGYGPAGGAVPELWLVDLATDEVTFKKVLPEVTSHPTSLQVGRTVLKQDGSLAWTELTRGGTYEVLEHTARGTKVLDHTLTTRPYSLKLNGSTLSWLEHDGELRNATLR